MGVGWEVSLIVIRQIVNLIDLGATQGTGGIHFWGRLGWVMEGDLGYYICPLSTFFLHWSNCASFLSHHKLSSILTIPFHHDVSALKPTDHGLNPLKPQAKLNLSSDLWVLICVPAVEKLIDEEANIQEN